MQSRDYRDIIGGTALITIGGGATYIASATMRFGTLTNMGPGLFPGALGVILALFGVGILIPAFFRSGVVPEVEWRPFIAVLVSMLSFAGLVGHFGMVPAIVALTVIASRADSKLGVRSLVALIAVLSVAATLIFQVALGLQLHAFNWPW